MHEETHFVSGSGLMSWRSGRSEEPAVSRAPVTRASTWPYCTIMAPK